MLWVKLWTASPSSISWTMAQSWQVKQVLCKAGWEDLLGNPFPLGRAGMVPSGMGELDLQGVQDEEGPPKPWHLPA